MRSTKENQAGAWASIYSASSVLTFSLWVQSLDILPLIILWLLPERLMYIYRERETERQSSAVRTENAVKEGQSALSLSRVSLVLYVACSHGYESRRVLHGIKELCIVILITGIALLRPLHTCHVSHITHFGGIITMGHKRAIFSY